MEEYMAVEYHLIFPKTYNLFNDTTVTFSIEHIKSRITSVLYFILRCYDKDDNVIFTYKSPRWAIDTSYKRRVQTFDIGKDSLDNTVYVQLELVSIGTSSENPLYFNGLMLVNDYDLKEHHAPDEHTNAEIGFLNTRYANLYDSEGNFLQVIRPVGDKFETNKLNHSECTVIAPHFSDESDIDDPINIFYEFINQVEQRIDVLR